MLTCSFSYSSFEKFHGQKSLSRSMIRCYIQISVIMRCVIRELHCNEIFYLLLMHSHSSTYYHAWLSSGARFLNFCVSLHLCSKFVCASSEDR